MKILINTPSLKLLGGVANHYIGLKSFWSEDIKYNTVGKRSKKKGSGKFYILWDMIKFIFRLILFNPDVILLNPSLGKSAIVRDNIFLKITSFFKKKVVIHIHGWDKTYADNMNKKRFIKTFNKASLVLVLADDFKKQLKDWGITIPIELTTTKVDDNLLKNFDPYQRNGLVKNILFLARIEKTKGIYEAIDTFTILKQKYIYLELTIVGDGDELFEAQQYVSENGISDVLFTGRLNGDALIDVFKNADLYLFPSFGEGMPTSVLEAMAFGLPVFTRNVGGLPDFFEDGKMGFITDSLNAEDFADAMILYIEDVELTREVSVYNAKYSAKHFFASKIAAQLEEYCRTVL